MSPFSTTTTTITVFPYRSVPNLRMIFLAILPFLLLTNARASDLFDDYLKKRLDAAREIAIEFRELQTRTEWCKAAEDCDDTPCLPSSCSGGGFGDAYMCSSKIKLESQPTTCAQYDRPEDALLNNETGFLRIDSDKTINGGDGGNISIIEPHVRRDVCSGKRFRHSLRDAYKKHNLTHWIYGGTSNGVQISFPGHPSNRTSGYPACNFNPVARPWYIRASSGPKDVVFLLDKTRSREHGPLTSLLGKALLTIFESLDQFDNVAVVAFDGVQATTLGDKEELRSATATFLGDLESDIKQVLSTTASPNLTLAFNKAFDLYDKKSEACTRLIVLLSLEQDSCFDSCRSSGSDCRCVENLQKTIANRQNIMNEPKASIITFTETGQLNEASDMIRRNHMERLARTIACDKEDQKLDSGTGIWKRVLSASDTKDTAMETYTQMLAAPRRGEEEEGVITSHIYTDEGGLGQVFTISKPVFESETNRFVGVVGVDVTVKEMADVVGEEAAQRIERRAAEDRRCPNNKMGLRKCDVQFIRRSQRNSAECTELQPEKKCYEYNNDLFMPMNEVATWSDARDKCKKLANGATLPVISEREENAFLAQIASSDGSWIGLQAQIDGGFIWDDKVTKFEYSEFSSLYNETAVKQGIHKMGVNACVTIDRRGTAENWNVEACSVLRRFICNIPATWNGVCGGEAHNYEPPRCSAFGDSGRRCTLEQDKALEDVNPICKEQNTSFSSHQRACCDSPSDRSRKVATDDGGLSPVVIGVIFSFVGMFVIIIVGFLIYLSIRLIRKRGSDRKERNGDAPVLNEQPNAEVVSKGNWGPTILPEPPFPPPSAYHMYRSPYAFHTESSSGGVRQE